ncbi:MAG: O-antigen ligase family protein [Pseudomonadota bacterium]
MANVTETAPLRPGRAGIGGPSREADLRLPLIATLYLCSLVLPMTVAVGPVILSMYRLVLLLAFVPLALNWIMGRYDRVYLADLMLLGFVVWYMLAMFVHHGSWAIEAGGQNAVDAFGAYLLARASVRSAAQFRAMVKYLVLAVLFTLPFAVYEALTAVPILNQILANIPGVNVHPNMDTGGRLGLDRVQGPFEHPILYGVFCASVLSLAYLVRGSVPSAGVAVFGGFLSLSTGALMAMMVQIGLLGWNWITRSIRARWKLLLALTVLGYIVIDLLSNRSPVQVLITYATLNSATGYWRLAIWEHGSQNVLNNPLFGIGFNDWVRPAWMISGSVDNFWLLIAMRSGLPGVILMIGGFFLAIRGVARVKAPADSALVQCQRAWLITLVAVFLAICTVHVWNGTYSFLFFLIGAGVWMIGAETDDAAPAAAAAPELRGHLRQSAPRPPAPEPAASAPPAPDPVAPGTPEALARARARRATAPRGGPKRR